MCGSKRRDRGFRTPPPPPPGKSQVIWVSLEISIWTPPPPPPLEKLDTPPPLENVGPTLDHWKSIVFSVIKPLDLLCKLLNKLRTKKHKKSVVQAVFGSTGLDPPPSTDKSFWIRAWMCSMEDPVSLHCLPKYLYIYLLILVTSGENRSLGRNRLEIDITLLLRESKVNTLKKY